MAFLLVLFSACKKEYTCNNGAVYKQGSKEYYILKSGQTLTDNNGQKLNCY